MSKSMAAIARAPLAPIAFSAGPVARRSDRVVASLATPKFGRQHVSPSLASCAFFGQNKLAYAPLAGGRRARGPRGVGVRASSAARSEKEAKRAGNAVVNFFADIYYGIINFFRSILKAIANIFRREEPLSNQLERQADRASSGATSIGDAVAESGKAVFAKGEKLFDKGESEAKHTGRKAEREADNLGDEIAGNLKSLGRSAEREVDGAKRDARRALD